MIGDLFEGFGRSVGSCGELAQGFLADGTPFHVTCPIDLFSEVHVQVRPAGDRHFAGFGSAKDKMRLACQLALEQLGRAPASVSMAHRSSLDPEKGMASSTADIVAIIRAVADAFQTMPDARTIAAMAASIERSDGVMYDGVNAVNHLTGELIHAFQWVPAYTILMCIPPEGFATCDARLDGERNSKPASNQLLDALISASAAKCVASFSDACSESARLNAHYRPNPLFSLLEQEIEALSAVGCCVGHTGTVVGLLYEGADARLKIEAAKEYVARLLPAGVRLQRVSLQR